jgi:hypothetical protein
LETFRGKVKELEITNRFAIRNSNNETFFCNIFNQVRHISTWLRILLQKVSDEFANHTLLLFRNGLVNFAHFVPFSDDFPLQVPYRHGSLGLAVSGLLDINATYLKLTDLAMIAANEYLF